MVVTSSHEGAKAATSHESVVAYMRGTWAPLAVRAVLGLDDTDLLPDPPPPPDDGLVDPLALLRALLLFSVEERRNYPDNWLYRGGRYMPLRVALGVIYEHWTAKTPDARAEFPRGLTRPLRS